MLDCSKLAPGDKCYYKGKPLIFQRTVTTGKTQYYSFKNQFGKEKRLSLQTVQKDCWVEIFLDEETIAAPGRD
jgi:hypothetical protein